MKEGNFRSSFSAMTYLFLFGIIASICLDCGPLVSQDSEAAKTVADDLQTLIQLQEQLKKSERGSLEHSELVSQIAEIVLNKVGLLALRELEQAGVDVESAGQCLNWYSSQPYMIPMENFQQNPEPKLRTESMIPYALLDIGKIEARNNKISSARQRFLEIITKYPDSKVAGEAKRLLQNLPKK